MAETDVKIVVRIKDCIEQCGGNYSTWYVGRAEYPEEALVAHGVNLDKDRHIYFTTANMEEATSIVHYFITRLGTDGNKSGHCDEKALGVYAYEKSATTHP